MRYDVTPAERGMSRAASHAQPADLASVRMHAECLASYGTPFTSDDVRSCLSETQNERLDAFPHSLGAVFYGLHKEGTILPVGWTMATRPEARGRGLRLWVGSPRMTQRGIR